MGDRVRSLGTVRFFLLPMLLLLVPKYAYAILMLVVLIIMTVVMLRLMLINMLLLLQLITVPHACFYALQVHTGGGSWSAVVLCTSEWYCSTYASIVV